jgi:hypothetical protein
MHSIRLCHKDKMELPYEPMKRTTTALKQEKEEAFMMVAAFYRHTTGRNENKYYCKCTIENDGISIMLPLIIIETRI